MTDSLTENVGSKVILLYREDPEKENIERVRDVLKECGIVPIACKDPNNFRFVVPEIVPATSVDLIGRLALQVLGSDKPLTNFAIALRDALVPKPNTMGKAK